MVKVIAAVLTALYPVVVFAFLVVLKLPVRILSLCVIALSFAAFLSAGIKGKSASAGASVGGASAGRGAFGGAATLAGGVSAPGRAEQRDNLQKRLKGQVFFAAL